jgi:hypothetical protein
LYLIKRRDDASKLYSGMNCNAVDSDQTLEADHTEGKVEANNIGENRMKQFATFKQIHNFVHLHCNGPVSVIRKGDILECNNSQVTFKGIFADNKAYTVR